MASSLRQLEFRQPSTCRLESRFLTQKKRLLSYRKYRSLSVKLMALFAGSPDEDVHFSVFDQGPQPTIRKSGKVNQRRKMGRC